MGWCSVDARILIPTACNIPAATQKAWAKQSHPGGVTVWVWGLAFLFCPCPAGSWWPRVDETLCPWEMLCGSRWACAVDKRVSNGVPLPTSKPGRWTCQTQIMALRQHAVPCLGGLSEDRDHSKCDFVEPCPLSLCLFSLLLLPPDLFGSALSPDSPWQLIS